MGTTDRAPAISRGKLADLLAANDIMRDAEAFAALAAQLRDQIEDEATEIDPVTLGESLSTALYELAGVVQEMIERMDVDEDGHGTWVKAPGNLREAGHDVRNIGNNS
jgi:hypothetical protein